MKKSMQVVLVVALLGTLLVSGCSLGSPRIPVVCGDEVLKVKVDEVSAYKEACGNIATEEVAQQPEYLGECGYNDEIMINGTGFNNDFRYTGRKNFRGILPGPAIVQLKDGMITSIFPGEAFNLKGEYPRIWAYNGSVKCLEKRMGIDFPDEAFRYHLYQE